MIKMIATSALALTLLAAPGAHADDADELRNFGQSNPGAGDERSERRRDRRDERNRLRDGDRDRQDRRRDDGPRDDEPDDRHSGGDEAYRQLYGLGQSGRFGRDDDRDRDRPDGFDRLEPDDRQRDRDRRDRDRRDRNEDRFERAEPGLGHKVIAGLWTGTVEEVGSEPYTIRLSLSEDGSGTAAYTRLNCASEILPIAGRLLEYRETITMGREACEDGIVRLRLRKGVLLWSWRDRNGEIRAAATLKRDSKKADGGGKIREE